MALSSTRKYSYWYNSQGDTISLLNGFFVIDTSPTLMSTQTINFLKEQGKSHLTENNIDSDILNFLKATYAYSGL